MQTTNARQTKYRATLQAAALRDGFKDGGGVGKERAGKPVTALFIAMRAWITGEYILVKNPNWRKPD